jgi:hypothetical protein
MQTETDPIPTEIDWTAHLRAQAASGMSGAEYCRRHGLAVHRFYYRKQREGAKREESGEAGFIELASPGAGLVLRWGEALRLEVAPDFDAATLKRVIRVLSDS